MIRLILSNQNDVLLKIMEKLSMFGIKAIGGELSALNATLAKFNQTIHGSTEAAARTTGAIKSGASGMMTAKGIKDCVVRYQCNDSVCFPISCIGTTADLGNFLCGNIPGLKKVTPLTTYLSLGCKYFVHACRTGSITFSCNDPT
jgi:hypothetical protein